MIYNYIINNIQYDNIDPKDGEKAKKIYMVSIYKVYYYIHAVMHHAHNQD